MEDALFAEDDTSQPEGGETNATPWHILIVDDEESIHQITEMVLRTFTFKDRPLKISKAYNAAEAITFMEENHDVALAIVDVVMETDHAGLDLVHHIRNTMENRYTRLVLRTGQPGQAPEESIIHDYDIDDYKDKTELTSAKLITLMYASLRAYDVICTLDQHRHSLEQVVQASTDIFETSNLSHFTSAVLRQICVLLELKTATIYCTSINEESEDDEQAYYKVLAASDRTQPNKELNFDALPAPVYKAFKGALNEKRSFCDEHHYVGYFATSHGSENLLHVEIGHELTEMDRQVLDIFASNVAVTYENLLLRDEIIDTQRELTYLLGEAVEQRSKETGSHVKRVAQYSHIMALQSGLSEEVAELIRLASPLHDVGKIGIPDRILKKPGKLDKDEWEIMQTHAQLGADILSRSNNEVIEMASIIASQHHERWDGNGYPNKLKGEEIHIAGRITAIADVFDALGSKRCYKEAWPLDDIMEEIDKNKGTQFDPALVDILHKNLDIFVAIRDAYPD